jgi:hypothetical protein
MKTGKRCKIGKKHKRNKKNQIRRSWRRAERITSKQHGKQKREELQQLETFNSFVL